VAFPCVPFHSHPHFTAERRCKNVLNVFYKSFEKTCFMFLYVFMLFDVVFLLLLKQKRTK